MSPDPYVFVSYSSADLEQAKRLVRLLASQGVRCWRSDRDLPIGADYSTELPGVIAAARAMVLLVSATSTQSYNVRSELHIAERMGVRVLPLRIEPLSDNGGLDWFLCRYQWLDYFGREKAPSRDKLLQHLTQLGLGRGAARRGPPAAAPGSEPAQPLTRWARVHSRFQVLVRSRAAMALAATTAIALLAFWLVPSSELRETVHAAPPIPTDPSAGSEEWIDEGPGPIGPAREPTPAEVLCADLWARGRATSLRGAEARQSHANSLVRLSGTQLTEVFDEVAAQLGSDRGPELGWDAFLVAFASGPRAKLAQALDLCVRVSGTEVCADTIARWVAEGDEATQARTLLLDGSTSPWHRELDQALVRRADQAERADDFAAIERIVVRLGTRPGSSLEDLVAWIDDRIASWCDRPEFESLRLADLHSADRAILRAARDRLAAGVPAPSVRELEVWWSAAANDSEGVGILHTELAVAALQHRWFGAWAWLEKRPDALESLLRGSSAEHGTLLHAAVQFGNLVAVEDLLNRGADVDAVDRSGRTTYAMALLDGGRLAIARRLLQARGSASLPSRHWSTESALLQALLRAAPLRSEEVLVLLEHSGLPLEALDREDVRAWSSWNGALPADRDGNLLRARFLLTVWDRHGEERVLSWVREPKFRTATWFVDVGGGRNLFHELVQRDPDQRISSDDIDASLGPVHIQLRDGGWPEGLPELDAAQLLEWLPHLCSSPVRLGLLEALAETTALSAADLVAEHRGKTLLGAAALQGDAPVRILVESVGAVGAERWDLLERSHGGAPSALEQSMARGGGPFVTESVAGLLALERARGWSRSSMELAPYSYSLSRDGAERVWRLRVFARRPDARAADARAPAVHSGWISGVGEVTVQWGRESDEGWPTLEIRAPGGLASLFVDGEPSVATGTLVWRLCPDPWQDGAAVDFVAECDRGLRWSFRRLP
ncbi:MAG: TIR domain-containing protein [Planctomycetaceae bacterium]|nr:TIR domain-containing protein [Planctomycetaceae bacterium]